MGATSNRFLLKYGLVGLYALAIFGFTFGQFIDLTNGQFLVTAALLGGYMALNIGANDVANNVGPAVGSKAVSLAGAILIAAIFEASGALIAGGDVVGTVKKGIIKVFSN